ncbi:hypothetical protein [Nocardia sp. NPDC051832]|uniref:DUF7373 family lipoprotein n=1 Tax=Nocardia sp. NPDC051832 TaxID=3155673 RepID=UPI00341A99F6
MKRLWACAAITLALTTGCSAVIDGHPEPGMSPVDVAVLRTGGFTKEPAPYQPRFTDASDVRLIESRRMLDFLVHPFDVDSEITSPGTVRLFNDPASLVDEAFPEQYKPVAEKFDLLAGVYVSRTNGNLRSRKRLIISVMRFATEADSKNARDEFVRIADTDGTAHAIPIDGYPEARATSVADINATVYQAHGPYVIAVNAGLPHPDPAAHAAVFKKALDLQIPLLDKQKPVPLDDLLDLPVNPDGILRRAAPPAKDYSDPFFDKDDFGHYQPAGMLHFERNPLQVRKAFEEGGVDLIGRQAGTVYRTRDLAAAFRLQLALTIAERTDEPIDPPANLRDARCLRLDTRDFNRHHDVLCAVVFGRYVAVVVGIARSSVGSDPRMFERVAAQYSILAKSE